MSMLEWNDGLSTGIERIDNQHKKLVDIVNRIHDGMLANNSYFQLSDIFTELRDYTTYHFSTEEDYMEKYAYQDTNVHKNEHHSFVEKFTQVEQDCKSGKNAISMDILNYLSSWLVTHILGTDKNLGAFLQSKGAH